MTRAVTFYTASLLGVDAILVSIEAKTLPGTTDISILGAGWINTKDIKHRILSSLHELGIELPPQKYLINISPLNINKTNSSCFDLPILLTILAAIGKFSDQDYKFLKKSIIYGELSLFGDTKYTSGCLSIALSLEKLNKQYLLIPEANIRECSIISNTYISSVGNINTFLKNVSKKIKTSDYSINDKNRIFDLDMNQIYGQHNAKKASEIASAGSHHILFYGPPGSGKTMMAKRIPTIAPLMNKKEIIETSSIYSSAGLLSNNTIITQRPFRSPHHSVTTTGLIGGGSFPYPGEVSLAHNGILFLDEFVELTARKLEMLREVLEDREANLKRANYSVSFPASFILIGAMNPCPCGFFGFDNKKCTCTLKKVQDYLSKLSGPLLDRIDLQVAMHAVTSDDLINLDKDKQESSSIILERVQHAVDIQTQRNPRNTLNGLLLGHELDSILQIDKSAKKHLSDLLSKLNLSMRSYYKILKIARTISDLNGSIFIKESHINEALMYRSFDKFLSKTING